MKVSKGYIKGLGLIRVLACIAILLYHMNILKGGYLAVCIFFVLTGFLSCISCFKKEKFSFKDYYFNKFKNIYVPLLSSSTGINTPSRFTSSTYALYSHLHGCAQSPRLEERDIK